MKAKNQVKLPPRCFGVRWKTQLCDASGKVIRDLQSGQNMITDWGMDQLSADLVSSLVNYVHLGSTTEILKRLGGGTPNLTVTYTDAATIALSTDVNFFESGDLGRTFKIDGWPEMLITGYTDEQHVDATARAGMWLPGFTPAASPAGPYTDFGVHYTDTPTLASQFTKYNTYDTGASDYNAELNDSANSRFIHQRIFLSETVMSSAWTVNELGWSNGNASNNCFGKVVLGSPDVIPVGNKYRVTLQVYDACTPIDLSGVSLDWGATVGTHTCDVRMERIPKASNPNHHGSFLNPKGQWLPSTVAYYTGTFNLSGILWEDDAGYSTGIYHPGPAGSASGAVSDSTYTSGEHMLNRTIRVPDTVNIAAATGLAIGSVSSNVIAYLAIKPSGSTITKPSGYWIQLAFPIHWTRELVN